MEFSFLHNNDDSEDIAVGDSPPSDRPKRRGRRTNEELRAAGIEPKSRAGGTRVPRGERWSRYSEIFSTIFSVNSFILGTGARDYALLYYNREEVAKQNQVSIDRIPPSELEQLAQSFDNYQSAEPKLHRYVELMLARSPGVAFAIVCIAIAMPRLERAGLLPWVKKQQIEPLPSNEGFEPTTVPNNNGFTPAGPVGAPINED